MTTWHSSTPKEKSRIALYRLAEENNEKENQFFKKKFTLFYHKLSVQFSIPHQTHTPLRHDVDLSTISKRGVSKKEWERENRLSPKWQIIHVKCIVVGKSFRYRLWNIAARHVYIKSTMDCQWTGRDDKSVRPKGNSLGIVRPPPISSHRRTTTSVTVHIRWEMGRGFMATYKTAFFPHFSFFLFFYSRPCFCRRQKNNVHLSLGTFFKVC